MMNKLPTFNTSCGWSRKSFICDISTHLASLWTEITVLDFYIIICHYSCRMSFEFSTMRDVNLVTQACKIFSEWAPHHLNGVYLCIFNPLIILSRIDPEWKPVRIGITGNFIIEFELLHTIISNEEVAGAISALINARILMDGFINVVSCYWVSITDDVRCFGKLGIFPAAWACTTATMAEWLSKNWAGIDMIPSWLVI